MEDIAYPLLMPADDLLTGLDCTVSTDVSRNADPDTEEPGRIVKKFLAAVADTFHQTASCKTAVPFRGFNFSRSDRSILSFQMDS
ncbi:hypothetical protein MSSAC_1006 [Methanosarcina siciliae C2J]|uniref:Uncharacterized protein n=1 Tax=Methanosarcina siciliae C2J TaxID=1434118 RepID=A0A0E3LCI8_9EURY|nr:hypothetical protein MSSAC_1006 [Methanosarcina siciliae C2J]